jgi:hypothetical protein
MARFEIRSLAKKGDRQRNRFFVGGLLAGRTIRVGSMAMGCREEAYISGSRDRLHEGVDSGVLGKGSDNFCLHDDDVLQRHILVPRLAAGSSFLNFIDHLLASCHLAKHAVAEALRS